MKFKSQLDSTKFFYVQEGLAIGIGAAIAKCFFKEFPFMEFLTAFVLPLLALAFGFKSWQDVKTTESKNGKPKPQDDVTQLERR